MGKFDIIFRAKEGLGLSKNDYSDSEKTKLSDSYNLAIGAGVLVLGPSRGDSEMLGSSVFFAAGNNTVGFYEKVTAITSFNVIQCGLYAQASSVCVLRVYKSASGVYPVVPNLTFLEEKVYAQGSFNTNASVLTTINLNGTYTLNANEVVYVFLYCSSGGVPKLNYFGTQSSNNDRHGFLFANSSASPWTLTTGGARSAGYYQAGLRLYNSGALGALTQRVTSLENSSQQSIPATIAIAPKIYIPSNREIVVYSENIHKYFLPFRDRTEVAIVGGKTTSREGKVTPSSVGTIAGTVTVGNDLFDISLTKSFSVISTDSTNSNAVKVLNLGDSYTYMSSFANALAATNNVTFLGIRKATDSNPANLLCEGRGGWAITGLSGYVTANTNRYNPFMQPAGVYYYLGNTSHWITAINSPSDYNSGNVVTSILNQFNASTGYPNNPQTNQVIYDNSQSNYLYWTGSAWQTITAATLNFSFNFTKYRTLWGIALPDVVHILLGTNDFANTTETTFTANYAAYKAGLDAMVASIQLDSALTKIVIGIPVSSGKQGEFGTYTTERRKRAYWLLANALITDYSGKETSKVYLADYHSTTDRSYGFTATAEKPYNLYTGSYTENYLSDFTHKSTDGYKQMADVYLGIIQALR